MRRSRAAVVRETVRQLTDTTIKTFLDWFPPEYAVTSCVLLRPTLKLVMSSARLCFVHSMMQTMWQT